MHFRSFFWWKYITRKKTVKINCFLKFRGEYAFLFRFPSFFLTSEFKKQTSPNFPPNKPIPKFSSTKFLPQNLKLHIFFQKFSSNSQSSSSLNTKPNFFLVVVKKKPLGFVRILYFDSWFFIYQVPKFFFFALAFRTFIVYFLA